MAILTNIIAAEDNELEAVATPLNPPASGVASP